MYKVHINSYRVTAINVALSTSSKIDSDGPSNSEKKRREKEHQRCISQFK
jgi:hypothetical protein